MKKSEEIKKRLQEKVSLIENKKTILKEDIKIRKTPVENGEYKIVLTSDNIFPDEYSRETAGMSYFLKLKKGDEQKFSNRFDFERPTYWKDEKTGKFGWGYTITQGMNQEKIQKYLNNLKELVHDYNNQKKLQYDLETQQLTPEQINAVIEIVNAVEGAEEANKGTEVSVNLNKYLDSLQDAIENDDVFNFLIDTFQQVKSFQRQNLHFHDYSFLNSLIVRISDPRATYAAPKNIWEAKGYKIKPEYAMGITITKGGSKKDTTWENANWFKSNEKEWREFKNFMGLADDLTVEKYLKDGGRQAAYALASFGLKQGYIKNYATKFVPSTTYTDTMIEPIEGVEQVPLDSDEFSVKEDPTNSIELRDKIDMLFNAVSEIANKHHISILGVNRADGDINHLNTLLNKVLLKLMKDKYGFMEKTMAGQEMVKAYAEAVAHIVRSHFELPSESSKYNIASMGVEKKDLQQRSNALLNVAHHFIKEIEATLSTNQINEIKTAVRNTLFEYFKINNDEKK